jgi:hypothetical protein
MGYFLAALLGGFFLFNGAVTPDRVAHIAEKALQKQYPTAKVNVEMEGKRGKSVLKGNFKLIRIELADLTLADLPFATPGKATKIGKAEKMEVDLRNLTWGTQPLESVNFDFEKVEYDFDTLKKKSQFQFVNMASGLMKIRFSTKALRPAFAQRLKDMENVDIALEGDQFTLTGQRDVVGLKTPIVMHSRLVGVGNSLRLEETTLEINGVKLPAMTTNALVKDVNPIYSFDKDGKWPFNVRITSAGGQGDFLDLAADLTLKSAAPGPLSGGEASGAVSK